MKTNNESDLKSMSIQETDDVLEEATVFAKTLVHKPISDAIGQLQLAFNMDIISAKALMLSFSIVPHGTI